MEEAAEKKKPQKTKWLLLIAASIITLLILFYALHRSATHYLDGVGFNRIVCFNHLKSIGRELVRYALDRNDLYPDANKWRDILMEGKDFSKKILQCPDDKVGPCSYAMNPNCRSFFAPSDVVLLFESKSGWNQNGGPELLNPDNHFARGCNVLFNNGFVVSVHSILVQ